MGSSIMPILSPHGMSFGRRRGGGGSPVPSLQVDQSTVTGVWFSFGTSGNGHAPWITNRSFTVTSIKLWCDYTGLAVTGTMYCHLWEEDAVGDGLGGTEIGTSDGYDLSNITTTAPFHEWTFSTLVLLSNASKYYEFYFSGAECSTGSVRVYYGSNALTDGGIDHQSATLWTGYSNFDPVIQIYGY